jgi:hypothetical protein
MKQLIITAFMGLVMSSTMAASTRAPVQSPAAAKALVGPSSVVGVWRSDERTAQVSPGTLTLTADGRVSLAPDGFDPLVGTYKVQGQFLDLKTARGSANLIHTISQDTMTLEYEDGAVQNFKKQQPAGRNVKKDAKK